MKRISIFGLLAALSSSSFLISNSFSQEKNAEEAPLPLGALVEVKPRMEAYMKARNQEINELASKYGRVIEARLNKAADSGNLKMAKAFQAEKERIGSLVKLLAAEENDPITTAERSDELPDFPPGTPEELVVLRKIWTTEWQKIRSKLDGGIQQSLKALEIKFTKAREIGDAEKISAYRESLRLSFPTGTEVVGNSKKTPVTKKTTKKSKSAMRRDFEEKLVGTKWKDPNGFIYEFEKRGEALMTMPGKPVQIWKWEVEEPGKVRFIYSAANSIVFKFGEEGEDVIKEWYDGRGKLLNTMAVEEVK